MKHETAALAAREADAIPAGFAVIEVHVAELRQLFNSIDPSPFRERDLAPAAEAFIVDWSREVPATVPLALLVHLDGGHAGADPVRDRIPVRRRPGAVAARLAGGVREAVASDLASTGVAPGGRRPTVQRSGPVRFRTGPIRTQTAAARLRRSGIMKTTRQGSGTTVEEQNMELMQTLDDAWNGQDMETFTKRHKPDVVVRWPGKPPTNGIHAHGEESLDFFRTFPDQRIGNRPYRVFFASGDWTCSIARFTGTMTGPMKGPDGKDIPPTGKSFDVEFCTVARWDNGQIVEENLFYDLVTFMKQIGLGG